jgi:hypothetical protein
MSGSESASMFVTAEHLLEQVIRPTLKYLEAWSPETEEMLLRLAVAKPTGTGSTSLGVFRVTPREHRDIWDSFLAFQPDLASQIRGLASQRLFLNDPDSELQTNLSYCAAIAWLRHLRDQARSRSAANSASREDKISASEPSTCTL